MNYANKGILLTVTLLMLLTGCATTGTSHPQDPLEPINRKIFAFNETADKYLIKPIAQGYDAVFPDPVKKGVSNFYRNVEMIPTVANDLLQLKIFRAAEDTFRFAINTTIGVAGLFDPAEHMGLKFQHQDLGLTLAFWGWEDSSYMLLPIIGPSTLRDTLGFTVEELTVYPFMVHGEKSLRDKAYAIRALDVRYRLLDADKFFDDAIDKYAMQRDAYLQHREKEVNENKGLEHEDTYIE